jgi:hypothetical protein
MENYTFSRLRSITKNRFWIARQKMSYSYVVATVCLISRLALLFKWQIAASPVLLGSVHRRL